MTRLKGAQVTWLGHATFKVTTSQNKVILIDPWIEGNPKSPAEARRLDKVDVILVTHGHSDYINDAVPIAQKFHAQVVAMVETAGWISPAGSRKCDWLQYRGQCKRPGDYRFHDPGIPLFRYQRQGREYGVWRRASRICHRVGEWSQVVSCGRHLRFWRYAIDS